jgi:hypothetical protein
MSEERPVSDWLLERLARGELPAGEAAAVRARLAAEGGLGRLAALEASDREILAAHPPVKIAAEVKRRLSVAQAQAQARPRRPSFALPGLALGAAGALVLVLSLRPGPRPDGEQGNLPGLPATGGPDSTRIKSGGRPYLLVYRKTSQGDVELAPDTRVRPGDLLQIKVVPEKRRFGVVASVDARGTITLHLPEQPGAAVRLGGRPTALPHGFELDETPGFERLVFVTSDSPFDTAAVAEALRPPGKPLPPQFGVYDFTLRKESP